MVYLDVCLLIITVYPGVYRCLDGENVIDFVCLTMCVWMVGGIDRIG